MADFVFFSFDPLPELAAFVRCVWGVRGRGEYNTESVLPNGSTELMVNFGPVQQVVRHGGRVLADRYRRAWLAGIQDRCLVHASDGEVNHISAQFLPGGAHAFFDLPMDETANQVVELESLIGRHAEKLRDRLGEAAEDEVRARRLQDWLLERKRVVDAFPTVRRAAALLAGGGNPASVGEVCECLGLSNKSLVSQFRRTVGLTPKVFGRIERFQSVIRACRGRTRVDWQQLALSHGYADQSHLIREFGRLGNVTPTQFLARRTPDQQHVVVA